MLFWLLSGVGVAAFCAILVLRDAVADDKRRKMTKRPATPNNWE